MTSATSASSLTNYVDQYGGTRAPQNHRNYSRNPNGRSGVYTNENVYSSCPTSTSISSDKRAAARADDVTYSNTSYVAPRRMSNSNVEPASNKSMKEMSRANPCQPATDSRRRASEVSEKRSEMLEAQENESADFSYATRRRSNQECRKPRDSSVSGRRSRNTSPNGEDRISKTSSSRRRSSVSRNLEGENRRSSTNLELNSDETLGQRQPSRQYDSNIGDLPLQVRSKPYDPEFKDPPGQIRPSRRYDSTNQRQEQARHSRHYDMTYDTSEQNPKVTRMNYTSHEHEEETRRSSRHHEPHRDPPGQIRRSSRNLHSESGSQGQRRTSGREKQEAEVSSRRHSMCRSDSTGGDSHDGRRYHHRKPRGSEGEADQADSGGDSYRAARRSQSRHSDMRRSLSRSSSVEKSSDMEIEFRTRDRKVSVGRTRDSRNEEEANLQEQLRSNSKSKAYTSKENAFSGVETSEYKYYKDISNTQRPQRCNDEENYRYPRHEREHDRERTRATHCEGRRQRRRSSSVANEEPEYESADSRRHSSSVARGSKQQGRTRHDVEEHPRHTEELKEINNTRRRNSRSSKADTENEVEIATTDSRYDLALSQGSSYSLVSQISRQYPQPQASRSASRHEIPIMDDCNIGSLDRNQTPGHRRLHGRSSNRRRSSCSRDENEGAVPSTTGSRPEGSHSRRSSSSKSNQDTGFASSPSTPRREDSQSKFSSDASQSRYGINDDGKHTRLENGRRRRRSNLISSNSLDVPAVPLRKEQSLSSSGKGDSSFEEPAADHHLEIRKMRQASKRFEGNSDCPATLQSGEDINRNIDNVGESAIVGEIQALDALASKEIAVSSSGTSCSSNTLNKESYESAKALSSSTSTLKGATYTSKASIAGSISSLFGRNNNDGQPMQSVGDRWRRLKQDMMPDKDPKSLTDSGKEKAAAIFSAAAAKFMSSFPGVSAAFPNIPLPKTNTDNNEKIPQNDTETPDLHVKENGFIASTIASTEINSVENTVKEKESSVSLATSQTNIAVVSNTGDGAVSSQTATVTSSSMHAKPGERSSRLSVASTSNMSTSGKTPTVSPAAARRAVSSSQRPSIVSTELSSHERRANVYAAMTERTSDGSDSEDSGDMVSALVLCFGNK